MNRVRPAGRRSVADRLNGELRYRMSDAIELVYDGAGLFLGTGIGLRYITSIGSLRLDVGVPLDRRSGIDDIVQIYVSIGQAY